MNVTHYHTTRIARGTMTVLVVSGGKEDYALLVNTGNRSSPVIKESLDKLEAAIATYSLIERTDFITRARAQDIEEPLINWFHANEGTDWLHLRWRNERMAGFTTLEAAEAFSEERAASPVNRLTPSKGRKFMAE